MILLSDIANAVQGRLIGQDRRIDGVSIDGRKMPVNGLYVAIKGERLDGHDFIGQAVEGGAVAALVEKSVSTTLPVIEVANTRRALADFASYWRTKFTGKLIAVTGSNGKTTVKEMLASIMSECGETVATQGNLNNDLGVPLTLLRIRPGQHKFAVIEMGANHVGEIKQLCQMATPDVSLINNVGKAHLEGFGSIEDIVRAKSEIYQGLKEGGTAIINADDVYKDSFIRNAKPHKNIFFSKVNPADVTAKILGVSDKGQLHIKVTAQSGSEEIFLPLLGEHNAMNALAATTTALAAGASLSDIKRGIEKIKPVPGRLNVKAGLAATTVIDDTYNANPSSCEVALAALSSFTVKKVFVLGDMGELGDSANKLHLDVGQSARAKGVDSIFTLGDLSQSALTAFPEGHGHSYSDVDVLVAQLLARINSGELAGAVILVKGSRYMKMERVVKAITEDVANAGTAGGVSSNPASTTRV